MVYIAIVVGTLEQWSDDYLTCWMEILRHLEKTQHTFGVSSRASEFWLHTQPVLSVVTTAVHVEIGWNWIILIIIMFSTGALSVAGKQEQTVALCWFDVWLPSIENGHL